MSGWPLSSDDTPVKCLPEKNRSGFATKTGLFALMMAIHSSLFLIKVNQMVKRMVFWVPRWSQRWSFGFHELLEVVTHARKDVYFNNFFTFLPLLEELKNMSLPATGTIRSNRAPGLPDPSNAEMAKKNRGFMSVCSTNVCFVRWVENNVATVASNHLTHEPSQNCKCYSRAEKVWVDVTQPNLIWKYNSYMGGVGQLDSCLNNLRPCIGGKKWYWAQLINMVRVLQVAAYRFYCLLHSHKRVSQLDFLRNIVHQYVRTDRTALRKNYPSPTLCQPILTVISLSNILKVAASVARKIVAWFAALVMCTYTSIVSHYITRINLWTVIALKTLKLKTYCVWFLLVFS